MRIEIGQVWRTDARQPAEELACGFIQVHRRLPRAYFTDGSAEMGDDIVQTWHGTMTATAMRHQLKTTRDLLGIGHAGVLHTSVLHIRDSPFIQSVLRRNFVPGVAHKIVNAVLAGAFLAGLRQQNNIAIKRHSVAVQL